MSGLEAISDDWASLELVRIEKQLCEVRAVAAVVSGLEARVRIVMTQIREAELRVRPTYPEGVQH
jgi:hypothetical protein